MAEYAEAAEQHDANIVVADGGALAAVESAERNATMLWARQHPRSITGFRNEAFQLVTGSEGAAAQCIFALPRKSPQGRNISIEGPSARFAEIILYSWRNCQAGARIIGFGNDSVTAQGVFYDYQSNIRVVGESQRRIVDRDGRRYSVDMLVMTANAAQAIARRNAILSGIPRAIWWPLYESARKLVAGDTKTLANRRIEAVKAFTPFGLFEEDVLRGLDRPGMADVTIDDLVTLSSILQQLKEGELQPDDAFGPAEPAPSAREQLINADAPPSAIRDKVQGVRRRGRRAWAVNRVRGDHEQFSMPEGDRGPQQPGEDANAAPTGWTPTPEEEAEIRRREEAEAQQRRLEE